MTEKASRRGGTAHRRRSGLFPRAALTVATGLLLIPALTTEVALQDMTSLIEGGSASSRWQAYFVPSPAGSIATAKVAFAERTVRDRLPHGAGIEAGNGDVFTMDTDRPSFDSPDEARVTRSQKSGRVLAVTPRSALPPRGLDPILGRQTSLLRLGVALGAPERLAAFAKPATAETAIALAMTFAPKRTPAEERERDVPEARVMVASLETKAAVPQTAALGYAAAEAPGRNPVAALFGKILREGPTAFIPPIGKDDHSWAATPLPLTAYSAKEQNCLATGIYFEARGESQTGQAAVAQVILNRVRNPAYPKTICGVVYQNKNWRNRCQFSFACDGIKDRITNKRAFSTARRIAGEVTRGETWIADVGSATHYHANYVKPRWAKAMERVDKIGRHIFYRTYGGGWN